MSKHVIFQMPLKRKLDIGTACAPVLALEGSRFVNCPICFQRIAHYLINSHLDDECGKSTSLPVQTLPVRPGCLEQPENMTCNSQYQGTGAPAPSHINSASQEDAYLMYQNQDNPCRHAR